MRTEVRTDRGVPQQFLFVVAFTLLLDKDFDLFLAAGESSSRLRDLLLSKG